MQSKFVPEIRHHCPNTPFLLAGTRCESRDVETLVDKCERTHGRGCIGREEGEAKATEIGARGYFEVSADLHTGFDELFDLTARISVNPTINLLSNDNMTGRDEEKRCVIC